MSIQVKHLTFEEHEINAICEAIILAQESLGDKKTMGKNKVWDELVVDKISRLDAILKAIYSSDYRGLPEPEEEQVHLCNEVKQSLPFIEP